VRGTTTTSSSRSASSMRVSSGRSPPHCPCLVGADELEAGPTTLTMTERPAGGQVTSPGRLPQANLRRERRRAGQCRAAGTIPGRCSDSDRAARRRRGTEPGEPRRKKRSGRIVDRRRSVSVGGRAAAAPNGESCATALKFQSIFEGRAGARHLRCRRVVGIHGPARLMA
jgi:hypothetical protein